MARLSLIALSLTTLLSLPALAKECRIPDAKPGQPIRVPAECKEAYSAKNQQLQASKSDPGAIDLGNGTTVRIGGRVRAEMGWRR